MILRKSIILLRANVTYCRALCIIVFMGPMSVFSGVELWKSKISDPVFQDSSQFRTLVAKGLSLVEDGSIDEAINTFKSSFRHSQNLIDSIEANYEIAEAFDRRYKLDSSLLYLDEAVRLMNEKKEVNDFREKEIFAKVYRKWRVIKYDLGDYNGARDASLKEKALIDGDTAFVKRYRQLYLNMSVEFWAMAKLPEAIDMAYHSLSSSTSLDDEDPNKVPGVLRSHMMLGLIFDNMGQSEKAIAHHKLVLDVIGDDVEKDAYNYMATSTNIGNIYMSWEDHTKASEYFNQALVGLEMINTHATYWIFKFSILHNLGMNATAAGDYSEAQRFFEQASVALGKGVPNNHPKYGILALSIGRNFQASGNNPKAIDHFKKAIQNRKQAFGERSAQLSEIYNELGVSYYEDKEFILADTYFDSALYSNPSLELNSKLVYENSTQAILTSSNKIMNLENTHPNIRDRKSALMEIYQGIIDQANMSFILGEDISEDIISLFEVIYIETQNLYTELQDTELLEMLWEITEYDKSRRLLVHLNEQNAFESAIPESYVERQQIIQDSIESVLSTEFDDKKLRDSTLTVLNTAYDNLIRELGTKFPEYHALKYNHEVVSLESVQKSLNNSNAVVEYYIGDSTSHVTVITPELIETRRLIKDSLFEASLNSFQLSLRKPDKVPEAGDLIQSSYTLYQYLIEPISDLIANLDLIIVPSPELFTLPFDVLLTQKVHPNEISHFKSLPFLIKQRALSYANSMTLLNNSLSKPSSRNNGRILAFAPSFGTNRSFQQQYDTLRNGLAPLKWTFNEIENISGKFKSDVFLEDNATETRFRSIAKDYSVIHIASHGMVNDVDPMYSKIVLSTNESDSLNDGYLHTFELFNTTLNADMAVLSACNTGFGKVQPGEGVMSLAQGFMYSGVKSTIMSLWLANDESTAKIMNGFYNELAKGATKDQALRKAKLDYLNSSDNLRAHPFYWAQFIANGNMRPIKRSASLAYYWYAFIALLIVGSIIRHRNKTRPV